MKGGGREWAGRVARPLRINSPVASRPLASFILAVLSKQHPAELLDVVLTYADGCRDAATHVQAKASVWGVAKFNEDGALTTPSTHQASPIPEYLIVYFFFFLFPFFFLLCCLADNVVWRALFTARATRCRIAITHHHHRLQSTVT